MTLAERATADLVAALTPLADQAIAGRPFLLSASLPIGAADPIALYAAGQHQGASLWMQPREGTAMVGFGEAWAAAIGAEQSEPASQSWRTLIRDAVIETNDAPRGAGPLLLGGIGFGADHGASSTWAGFRSQLTLPSLLVTTTPNGAWLTASLVHEGGVGQVGASIDRLQRAWDQLAGAAGLIPETSRLPLRVMERRPDAPAWRESVARLAGAVGRGRLDKVVLSREVTLQAANDIDVPAVLQRLAESAPESTVFAMPSGQLDRTFIGATPERLVRLEGRRFATMAMAGSTRHTGDSDMDAELAAELLASDKEREEHAVVVSMLRRELAPISSELSIARGPVVVPLRHIQHLVTPVSGVLADEADILTLVDRLHPTPAVAGMPRDLALELIADEETHDRGLYAGPLGWMDRHGDGEFVVALRSGVVSGASAVLFAGCGIVADSDPDREWDESNIKLQALGSALGRLEQ
jgi:isochorismate synthase